MLIEWRKPHVYDQSILRLWLVFLPKILCSTSLCVRVQGVLRGSDLGVTRARQGLYHRTPSPVSYFWGRVCLKSNCLKNDNKQQTGGFYVTRQTAFEDAKRHPLFNFFIFYFYFYFKDLTIWLKSLFRRSYPNSKD